MEKASIIFSILIHNDSFMGIFWGFLGILNLSWGFFCLRANSLSEKELGEIDPRFENINLDYAIFSLFAACITLFLLFTMQSSLDKWAMANYGREFYPVFVFFFSAYGIYQALFAIRKGVYPMGIIMSFQYAETTAVRRVAIYQITASTILFVVSVLFFLATSVRIQ